MKVEAYKRYFGDGLYEYSVTVPFYITQLRADWILRKDYGLDAKWIRVKSEKNDSRSTIIFYSLCSYDQDEIENAFRYCDEAKGAKIKHMANVQNYDWTSEAPYTRGFNHGFDKGIDVSATVLAEKILPVKILPVKIIQNGPATIIFWENGTKTVVKRKKGDKNDIDAAVAQAIVKQLYPSNSSFHRAVKNAVEAGKGEKKE